MEIPSLTSFFTNKTSQNRQDVSTKPIMDRRKYKLIQIILSMLIITILTIHIPVTSALPIDYEYQLDNSPPERTGLADASELSNTGCRDECEIMSAAECLHCLKYIDARVLSPDKAEIDEEDVEKNVNQIMGPLLWTSTVHYPANRLSIRAKQLLQRLQNSNSRTHKKDLRMTLQRRLNEQDINSMLRNNWVG